MTSNPLDPMNDNDPDTMGARTIALICVGEYSTIMLLSEVRIQITYEFEVVNTVVYFYLFFLLFLTFGLCKREHSQSRNSHPQLQLQNDPKSLSLPQLRSCHSLFAILFCHLPWCELHAACASFPWSSVLPPDAPIL